MRAPVTEYEEQQEIEAARERNDLDISDLREMSVTELRQVGRELELETGTQERKEDLVERILERQTERAGHASALVVGHDHFCADDLRRAAVGTNDRSDRDGAAFVA